MLQLLEQWTLYQFMLTKIKNKIKALYFDKKHSVILHLFLIFVVVWTRFVYLGYSDFQGDEIKAMFRPEEGQTLVEFLMEQRKGPLQFLITAAMEPVTNDYYNNFVLRLPFAIAGALAVLYFYKFVKLHFGKEVANYSALFMAINGFFIAFSRIVQYQSFTILLFILALYYFSKTLFDEKWMFKGWYLGALVWGLSALAHYDSIFITPFVLYIFVMWFIKYKKVSTKKKLLHVSFAGLITIVVIAAFYVPYYFNLTSNQLDYWHERLTNATGKISSSKYLFKIYNPIFVLKLYLGLIAISMFKIRKTWTLLFWAAFPIAFMEFLTQVPGTHIYTYILPLTIVMAFGLIVIKNLAIQVIGLTWGKRLSLFFFTVMFLFMFLISHTLFIDHSPEYPWQSKKFMFWEIPQPQSNYHLSIFGFPYYRHWEDIENYLRENTQNMVFGTNERSSIPRFYLDGFKKEGATANHFVYILNPQSFAPSIYQSKPFHWIRNLNMEPSVVYTNDGISVAKVYEMPLGTLEDLRNMGY